MSRRATGDVRGAKACPSFEGLETRLLMSGNVDAFISGGTLYLVGDSAANDVVVSKTTSAHSTFQISSGMHSATTINGGTDPVTLTGLDSIYAALGDGDDILAISDASGEPTLPTGDVYASLSRDLFVDAGQGSNTVTVNTFLVGGDLTVVNGNGTQTVGLQDLGVAGNIAVLNGIGLTDVELSHVAATKLLVVNSGVPLERGVGTTSMETVLSLSHTTLVGALTVISGVGNDDVLIGDSAVGGLAFIDNGPGGATFRALNSVFLDSIVYMRGDGGSAGTYGVGEPSIRNLAGSFTLTGETTVAGDVTVLNGAGVDLTSITSSEIGGNVLAVSAWGNAGFTIADATVTGSVTILNSGGPEYGVAGVGSLEGTGWRYYTSYTGIGESLLDPSRGVTIGGDVTIVNGAGSDYVTFRSADIAGNTYVNSGADGLYLRTISGEFDGRFTVVRGDGQGTLYSGVGNLGISDTGSYITLGATDFDGDVVILNGAGGNYLTTDAAATLGGNVTLAVGGGEYSLHVRPSVGGSLSIYCAAADSCEMEIGVAATSHTISGNLSVYTGSGSDEVSLPGLTVTGSTYVDLGSGIDYLSIEEGAFTGPVTVVTGPSAVAGDATDDDNITIEFFENSTGTSTFTGLLTMLTGAGNDTVTIGYASDPEAYAHFVAGFVMDGGLGTNTIDYLTHGNLFDEGALQTVLNATAS